MSNIQKEVLDFKVPSDVHVYYPGSYEKDTNGPKQKSVISLQQLWF